MRSQRIGSLRGTEYHRVGAGLARPTRRVEPANQRLPGEIRIDLRSAVECLAMWPSLRACAASAAVIAAASASSGGWQPPPQGYGQQYDYNNQAPPQQYEQYDQAQQYGGYDQQQQYGGYYDQQQPAWGAEPTYGEAEVVGILRTIELEDDGGAHELP